jgi:hypothetical protein
MRPPCAPGRLGLSLMTGRSHFKLEMSYTGLTVPDMTEPPRCHHVTVTVNRGSGHLPGPADFAIAAEQAASERAAGVMSAHTADQIISVVTIWAADRPAAVSVALDVVSEALKCPVTPT